DGPRSLVRTGLEPRRGSRVANTGAGGRYRRVRGPTFETCAFSSLLRCGRRLRFTLRVTGALTVDGGQTVAFVQLPCVVLGLLGRFLTQLVADEVVEVLLCFTHALQPAWTARIAQIGAPRRSCPHPRTRAGGGPCRTRAAPGAQGKSSPHGA